jgi:hypothetical protein
MNKLIISITILIGFIGFSQENPVKTFVDTTTIKIGEQIQFKISVSETENVIFPKLALDSLGKVEVVEAFPIDTLKNSLEKKYLLTSFDSGYYLLPKQQVLINNREFFTDSLLINVATVQVDTLKQRMFEIKSIKREPKTFDDYKHLFWWILAILAVIAIILYFIFRKRDEKEEIKVSIPPIQEALQRLKELDEKHLLEQQKVKIYYTELTDIVRTYIEKDIHIPALESTTIELIETINDFNESSNLGISKETIVQLKRVLESADLVKFAKLKPFIRDIKNDRTSIEEVLNKTQIALHEKAVNDAKLNPVEIGEPSIEIEVQPIKKTPDLKKYIIIFSVLFVVGLGAIGFFSYRYIKSNYIGISTGEMLNDKWVQSTYGSPEITLETPKILKSETVQLPQSAQSMINDFSIFSYGSFLSNFYIAVSSTSFINELSGISIDDAVKGSLNELQIKIGVKFTNLREDIRVNNGVEGRIVEGDFQIENATTQEMIDLKLTMLFFLDDQSMRQIIVTREADDDSAEKVSERIIKSVSIKK